MKFLKTLSLLLVAVQVACSEPQIEAVPDGSNVVSVIGAVHGQHKTSEQYSLDVLEQAIRKFKPDIVMVELPADRFKQASDNFEKYRGVRESRADDFPELTGVVFPLRKELGFTMVPVAAWSQKIADNRRKVTARIENDPTREKDWAAYQASIKRYNEAVSGRSDDPQFIHSEDYDEAVKSRQETYERLFGDDLGPGGWRQINKAHLALMNSALDDLAGQEKRILILFGAWHKYKILEDLEGRTDIAIVPAVSLFND